MSKYLEEFERNALNARLLNYAVSHVRVNEPTLRKQLAEARSSGSNSFRKLTYENLSKRLVETLLVAQNAMLRAAVEKYGAGINSGHDWRGCTNIKNRCPQFEVRCHTRHAAIHVIDLCKDLRDFTLHPLNKKYNIIKCSAPPVRLLAEELYVVYYPDRRVVILRGNSNTERFHSRLKGLPSKDVVRTSVALFHELLVEEVVSCIRTYDCLVQRRGKPTLHLPIVYS